MVSVISLKLSYHNDSYIKSRIIIIIITTIIIIIIIIIIIFVVAPCKNNIRHFIVQLKHTNYKILRLLK